MSPVKLAIAGGGVIGRRHASAIIKSVDTILVAIADPALSGKQLGDDMDVPVFPNLQALLTTESVDGVIVSTPTEHHFAPTMVALDSGCHVLVEKPIMATLKEADQVVAKAAESKRHVLVGHHRRYYSLTHRARNIIQSGELGQLVAVSGQWTLRKADAYYDPDWRKKWEAGPVLTNLIHEMDLLRYICGEIESISAEVSHSVRNWEKEDAVAMIMRFVSGAIGTFILSDQATSPWAWELGTGETELFPKTGQNSMRFMGTRAALDFPNLALWHHGDEVPNWNHVISPDPIELELEDAYALQIAHFAAVIADRERPIITAADGTMTLRTTLAVFEAASMGHRVIL